MKGVVLACVAAAATCFAQDVQQRGFLDTRLYAFPQTAPNDRGRAIGESLLRYEVSGSKAGRLSLPSGLKLYAGFDVRFDTRNQAERSPRLDWTDRRLQRPLFSVRRLSAVYNRGRFTAEVGKQFIRWGKTDIVIPTDRFAPRDYLFVLDNEFLGVPAARATYEAGSTTIDAVWQFRITPSRTPLLNQRWAVRPEELRDVPLQDWGARYPGGGAFGLRINHVGQGYDASVSFYDGWQHLPLFETPQLFPAPAVRRYYPDLRTYGADASVPLRWFTMKGEAAYFTSKHPSSDEFILYVLQLERISGEWVFVGGYAGEWVTERRSPFNFMPDRGLARSFVGRAAYTIDVNRSFAVETAIRQNGDGVWFRGEYSHALGQHWRATAGLTAIAGDRRDFLGQYRRNSNFALALRYSF